MSDAAMIEEIVEYLIEHMTMREATEAAYNLHAGRLAQLSSEELERVHYQLIGVYNDE